MFTIAPPPRSSIAGIANRQPSIGPGEVHGEHPVPRVEIHRHDVLVALVLVERGGVVVQHVEAAERGDGVGDHRRDRVGVGDVDGLRARRATGRGDLADDRRGRRVADVGDGDRAAFGRDQQRGRAPDARIRRR